MNHKFTVRPECLLTSAVGGGAEVTLTHSQAGAEKGNSVLLLFFFLFFNLCHFVL